MQRYVYQNIVKIGLNNELDIVLAYKRARQLSELTGLSVPVQTKFATAVSEICRNVIEHVGEGTIQFGVLEEETSLLLEAQVIDFGRGIPDVEQLLNRKNPPLYSKGWGIINSRKLVDRFQIQSSESRGTKVQLQMRIPSKPPPINRTIIKGWQDYFANEVQVSPYEELKQRNIQMLEVLEALRLKNIETDNQLWEIKNLNEELEKSHNNVNQLLREREATNASLQKVNSELEEFAYTVSHDLKSPLKNIQGLTFLLKKIIDAAANKKAESLVNLLQDQVHRMDNLINGILLYARSGAQPVEKKPVAVQTLLQDVIHSLGIPEQFSLRIREDLPTLLTEEIHLQQVFSNLIANAVNYHDQPEGTIEISCRNDGSAYTFCVADDGPGIPEELQGKIFDRFYTTSRANGQQGTGLGLSIVKKIVAGKRGPGMGGIPGPGHHFLLYLAGVSRQMCRSGDVQMCR
jgi:signal transduction histidine kinase